MSGVGRWLAVGAALGALGVGALVPARAEPAPSPDGLAVMKGAQCAACHAVPTVAEPPRTESCVGCHQWVRTVSATPEARAVAVRLFPLWPRYERSVASYFHVPDLGAAAARLDPAWVRAYLADPYDVRPHLPETMVRLGLDPTALDAVAAWFAGQAAPVPPAPAPDPAAVAPGERLYGERGCGTCHAFGARAAVAPLPSAPDLRHARDRMGDDTLVAWIVDPRAVAPTATMPALGLTREEATAIRDYLVLADPGGRPAEPPSAALPTVDRPVRWAEVEERVFGRICVHCHMDPAQNEGRAGPGNDGGFGWPATGIELQTPAGVRAHEAAILDALARRRAEVARDVVGPGEIPAAVARPAKPGMPLGLPALSAADEALVRAWFAQGAPD